MLVQSKLGRIVLSHFLLSREDLRVNPSDLSKFAPFGNGVYGYQAKPIIPIKGDPPQEPSAGIVYFGNCVRREDFEGFLRMMEVSHDAKDYGAFVQDSSNPLIDRYFRQMRIISRFGLRFLFEALTEKEYDSFRIQEPTVGEALWEFMDSEKRRFGTSFGDKRIEGKMGGDSNFAREELSFGFMLENQYYSIYRIWSRAWLVTK